MKLTQNVYFNILVNLKVKSIYQMICTRGAVREGVYLYRDEHGGRFTIYLFRGIMERHE